MKSLTVSLFIFLFCINEAKSYVVLPPDESNLSEGVKLIKVHIHSDMDDAEEQVNNGTVYVDSSDLELVHDKRFKRKDQIIGLRFAKVDLPPEAKVVKAYIQFTAKVPGTTATTLEIGTQLDGGKSSFESTTHNISARKLYKKKITWEVPPWLNVEESGAPQRTPNLKLLIYQNIKDKGWKKGDSMVFVISGNGLRTSHSAKMGKEYAPVLKIFYK